MPPVRWAINFNGLTTNDPVVVHEPGARQTRRREHPEIQQEPAFFVSVEPDHRFAAEDENVRRLVEEIPADHGEDVFAHPFKPTVDLRSVVWNGLHAAKVGNGPCGGLRVMCGAEGDHPSGIVMVFLSPWGVEVVVLKVRVTAIGNRAAETDLTS